MTYLELLEERIHVGLMAQRDQILFGMCHIETWIDEDGNKRSKHIPITDVYLAKQKDPK